MPGVTIGHPAVFYKQKEHHGRRERELEQIQTLYERYKNNVYRLALSYTGHRQDAEDVTQTVFVKLIRHMDRLQPGKEQSWLLTVTANECRNLLRQRSHMSQEAMPEPSSETRKKPASWMLCCSCSPNTGRWCTCFTSRGTPPGKLEGSWASSSPVSPPG